MRFARCLSVTGVKNIKKIMIYIREKEESNAELGNSMSTQMKEIMTKVLGCLPRGPIYKEFFSFLKEIFYYNQDMDDVDFNLANDTLHILNGLMKSSFDSREDFYKYSYLAD
jgi:hypothetical protein